MTWVFVYPALVAFAFKCVIKCGEISIETPLPSGPTDCTKASVKSPVPAPTSHTVAPCRLKFDFISSTRAGNARAISRASDADQIGNYAEKLYFRVGGGRRSVATFLYRALRPFKIANGLWLTRVLSIGYVLIQPFLAPPSHGWASEAGSFSVKLGSRSHSQPQHLIVRHLLF